LIDGEFSGKPRKLLAQASRNGYYFLIDRTNGKALTTSRFLPVDWASKVGEDGEPVPNPAKEPQRDGSLVRAFSEGATNWQAPSFDPQTNLFYVNGQDGFTIYYLTLDENGKPDSHQGGLATPLLSRPRLVALDYQTGKTKWSREETTGFAHPGILTTAGHLLITGDVTGNLLILDPSNGDTLWHKYVGGPMNSSPMTYEWNGRQYILTAVDGVLYAWTLPEKGTE
jgi:alcohol dehydrogenase (cytochrome c)